MTDDMRDHVREKAYHYGRAYEQRKRTPAASNQHQDHDNVCVSLLADLRALGALDDDGNLLPEYADYFDNGCDSVSDA